MKTALILGVGGGIGHHLLKKPATKGYWVRAVDLKKPKYEKKSANDFIVIDLSIDSFTQSIIYRKFDEVYQHAENMVGGQASYLLEKMR